MSNNTIDSFFQRPTGSIEEQKLKVADQEKAMLIQRYCQNSVLYENV